MAKRKAKKPTTRRRRRSVGALAVNKDLMTQAAGALVGFVGGQMIAAKLAPNLDKKIKGIILAAAGVIGVPMFLKNSLGKGISLGLTTAGGVQVLQSTGIISGIERQLVYMPDQRRIAGSGINAQVNGGGINAQVNGGQGINAKVSGYRPRSAMQTALKYS